MKSFLLMVLAIFSTFAEMSKVRLLVHIEPEATFTAKEFAEKSFAQLVKIDLRNPFQSLSNEFLEHDFVVLSDSIANPRMLRSLAARYGYRSVSFAKEELDVALHRVQELLDRELQLSNEIPSLSKEEGAKIYDLAHHAGSSIVEIDDFSPAPWE